MKHLLLFIISIFLLGKGFGQAEHLPVLTSDSFLQSKKEMALNGEWQYHQGDDTLWKQKNMDDKDWVGIIFPFDKNDSVVNFGVTGWYRYHFIYRGVPIYIAATMEHQGASEIYLDGVLLSSYGSFLNPDKIIYKSAVITAPFIFLLSDTGEHTIAVRYRQFTTNNSFVYDDESQGFEMKLASEKVGKRKYARTSYAFNVFLEIPSVIFFTLFFVHLIMFLYYKSNKSNLYFSIVNLSFAVVFLASFIIFLSRNINAIENLTGLIFIALPTACLVMSLFLNNQFGKSKSIRFKILAGLCLLVPFSILINKSLSSALLTVVAILCILEALYLIVVAIYKKKKGAKIIGAGILAFALSFLLLFLMGNYIDFDKLDKNVLSVSLIVTVAWMMIFSIPLSLSAYLAAEFSSVNNSLNRQLITVETLSKEKQQILESQNEELELKVNERTQELLVEKQKSDDLLLNILPQEVAEQLKEKGESKAQYYDEVSVLFTDFVNFTAISQKLGAEELLNELNINFTKFDEIMERNNLEKIKTIGDAYLAVSGLPIANTHHAQNAVNASIEIIEFVQKRKTEVPYGLDIRIGIHSGPLVAGIVGVKKFAYDIWGDTVNTAARMEQSSEPGKINISDNTFQLVKDEFECVHRGKITAKGKGEIDMYFVKEKMFKL